MSSTNKTRCTVDAKNVEKAVKRDVGYEMEVLCTYRPTRQVKYSKFLKSKLVNGKYLSRRHIRQNRQEARIKTSKKLARGKYRVILKTTSSFVKRIKLF